MRLQDDDRSIEVNIMKNVIAIDVMLKNDVEKSPTEVFDNSGRLRQGILGYF